MPTMLGVIVVSIVVLLTPAHYRLGLALGILPIWLLLGRLVDFGAIQVVAKATSIGAFMLIALAAATHPGPRRQLAPLAFVLVLVASMGFIYMVHASDRSVALAIRAQWFMLIVAALMVARVIYDDSSLRYVLVSLSVGLSAAVLITLSSLVLDSQAAFHLGNWRFFPYGANANQVGVVYAMATPLVIYLAFRTPMRYVRWLFIAIGAISFGLALLTASRQTLMIIVIAIAPVAMIFLRRPGVVIIAASVVALCAVVLVREAPRNALVRLASLESERWRTAAEYLDVVERRPFFGILGSPGELSAGQRGLDHHPHNAYLLLLYIGGFSYFLPMLLVILASAAHAVRCCGRARRDERYEPVSTYMLAAFFAAMILQGFAGPFIIYPTYTWAFFFALLAVHFMSFYRPLAGRVLSTAQPVGSVHRRYPQEVRDKLPLSAGQMTR